jgi:hypothetical protein
MAKIIRKIILEAEFWILITIYFAFRHDYVDTPDLFGNLQLFFQLVLVLSVLSLLS